MVFSGTVHWFEGRPSNQCTVPENTKLLQEKFITSPTDIEVHRKVELQDANIAEAQQNAFNDLCA